MLVVRRVDLSLRGRTRAGTVCGVVVVAARMAGREPAVSVITLVARSNSRAGFDSQVASLDPFRADARVVGGPRVNAPSAAYRRIDLNGAHGIGDFMVVSLLVGRVRDVACANAVGVTPTVAGIVLGGSSNPPS